MKTTMREAIHEALSLMLITKHLRQAGTRKEKIAGQIKGWDLSKPVWEEWLQPGERLVQFVSGPTVSKPFAPTGNYFALSSTRDQGSVGVGDGQAGRHRREFLIVRPFHALWGTAAPISDAMATEFGFSLRGPGGATQIFLSDRGLSSLEGGNADPNEYGL
jgi:hypothetical protein